MMEVISILAIIVVGVLKVIFMWLDYKNCKKQKNTDKD